MLKICRSVVLKIAMARNVYFVVEQPLRSSLYDFTVFRDALETVGAARYVTTMASFGGQSLKPLELWSNFPASAMDRFIARPLSQGWKVLAYTTSILPAFKISFERNPTKVMKRPSARKQKKVPLSNKKRSFSGARSKLKESSAYEDRFCAAVCEMFLSVREDA